MYGIRKPALVSTAMLLVLACSGADPIATDVEPPAAATDPAPTPAARAVPDVSGSWTFHERIVVLQPSELNGVIGAPAREEPMTKVVCQSEGTMELDQDGAAFEGTATQSVVCRVGDVSFVPPEFAFNPEFTLFDGRIRGHAVHFRTGHTLNVCKNRGSVRVQGGVVSEIRAVGDCPVPFDPGEHHSMWYLKRAP